MVAVFLLVFCFSCNKNSGASPVVKLGETTLDTAFTLSPISASIVGKWLVNKQIMQILTTKTGNITDTTYSGAYFKNSGLYQFNSDSTATFTPKTTFFISATELIDGSTLTIDYLVFTYKVAGPALTIAYQRGIPLGLNTNPGPYPVTIVQLDDKNLVVHREISTEHGSSKTVMNIYLTRQ